MFMNGSFSYDSYNILRSSAQRIQQHFRVPKTSLDHGNPGNDQQKATQNLHHHNKKPQKAQQ